MNLKLQTRSYVKHNTQFQKLNNTLIIQLCIISLKQFLEKIPQIPKLTHFLK